jgi:hypothetical protein
MTLHRALRQIFDRSESPGYALDRPPQKIFGDSLMEWMTKVVVNQDPVFNNKKSTFKDLSEVFLRSCHLEEVLDADALSALLSHEKAPSPRLNRLLAALVPEDVCRWFVFRNQGRRAMSKISPENWIDISDADFEKTQKKILDAYLQIVPKIEATDKGTQEQDFWNNWLDDYFEQTLARKNVAYDVEEHRPLLIKALAEDTNLTPEQVTAQKPAKKGELEEIVTRILNWLDVDEGREEVYDTLSAALDPTQNQIAITHPYLAIHHFIRTCHVPPGTDRWGLCGYTDVRFTIFGKKEFKVTEKILPNLHKLIREQYEEYINHNLRTEGWPVKSILKCNTLKIGV